MVNVVPIERLGDHAARFPGAQAQLALAAAAEGNSAAELWLAGAAGHEAALLWDKGNNVLYLAGALPAGPALAELAGFVAAELRPRVLAEKGPYMSLRPLTAGMEDALPALVAGAALHEVRKEIYELREPAPAADPPLEGLTFAPIDGELLAGDMQNVAEIRAEVRWMWPSEERFLQRGFGVAALLPGRAVCWCTAEYVSSACCGVGITTDPAYERRGIATAAAARFVAAALARGLRPMWECASDNLASARVAQKVGFVRAESVSAWVAVLG